jgi:hypothetical protein
MASPYHALCETFVSTRIAAGDDALRQQLDTCRYTYSGAQNEMDFRATIAPAPGTEAYHRRTNLPRLTVHHLY